MNLEVGRAYRLERMYERYWDAGHPRYGKPERIAAKFIGSVQGNRCWYLFEVWAGGKEQGVIMMNDDDLTRIEVSEIANVDE